MRNRRFNLTIASSAFRAAILLALGLGLGARTAQALPLREAAAVNGSNASAVKFNQVYRINPHNTYNPNTWHNLKEALSQGARVLEIDVYGSFGGYAGMPVGKQACEEAGGTFSYLTQGGGVSASGSCTGYDVNIGPRAMVDSEADAVAGRTIATRPGQHFLSLSVKHDPPAEDATTSIAWSLLPIVVPPVGIALRYFERNEFYGNNCSRGTALGVGGMQTELAVCLQTVRDWMDERAYDHSPILIYFDIKTDMDRLTALGFDATVRGVFGDRLFTPEQLKGSFPSPRARVNAIGWPTMAELHGKVVAIYNGGETFQLIGAEQPNDTLRYYVDGLADYGVAWPAAFVCPRISNAADVDTPYSFGRGPGLNAASIARLMGQVVCNNIYTGQHAKTQQTNARSFETALGAADAAQRLNLLSYLFSYNDPLALYPEVALEFVRHGVNFFDSEHFKDDSRSPFDLLNATLLPYEGLSGITNYGFVIRQRNSPFVLTAFNGKPVLRAYDGSPAQQWAITSDGRLFDLSDRECIGFPGLARFDHPNYRDSNYPVRPDSLYDQVTGNGYLIPTRSEPTMVGCGDVTAAGFFSLQPAAQSAAPGANGGGVVLALNEKKYNAVLGQSKPTLYLTPTAFNDSAKIVVAERTDEHATPPVAIDRRGERSVDYSFRAVARGPGTPVVPGQTIFLQEFDLYFDEPSALVVNSGLGTAPAKSVIQGGDEPRGGIPRPKTWRDYALTDANLLPVRHDPTLLDSERAIWVFAYFLERNTGRVANHTVLFTDVNRFNASMVVTDYQDHVTGSLPFQLICSEIMEPAEYQKWLSAVETAYTDLPHVASLTNLAHDLMTDTTTQNPSDPGCTTRFCLWFHSPLVSHPDPFQYWEIRNKPAIWYLASQVLSPDEYAKWQQRARLRPVDIAIDSGLEDLGILLLEPGDPSVLGSGVNAEQSAWFNEAHACLEVAPPQTPIQKCPGRYLAERPGHDSQYHWDDIPADTEHYVLAETAFNNPRPGFEGKRRPDEWTRWSAAFALRQAVSGRPLTFMDVPISAANHAVVAGSDLLSSAEKAKWLEKERLETQFVALQKPIRHLDVDPDELKTEVAQQYLSPAELALWQERAAVTIDDFPANLTLFNSAVAGKLLSATELAAMAARLATPDSGDAKIPTIWPDVPPARGRRFAAQYLLNATEYPKWLEAYAATEDDFPQVWTNAVVDSIAAKTLSASEFTAWKARLGPTPPTVINLNWLMFPHRSSAHWIAVRLLGNQEATTWVAMSSQALVPEHLGTSKAAAAWARSVLSSGDFSLWLQQANGNIPLTWQAFRWDRSLVQQRIVEAIFGVNSPDAVAWRADANGGESM